MIDYKKIDREYDSLRLRNEAIQHSRLEKVIQVVPEYKDILDSVHSIGAACLKARLSNQETINYKAFFQETRAKKERLLLEHGFSADFLDPIYDCTLCQDTGFIQSEKCICRIKKEINQLYEYSNLSEILKIYNFDTFNPNYFASEGSKVYQVYVNIYKHCTDYVKNFDETYRNMLFTGPVGSGKSFMACCVAKALLDKGRVVIFITSAGLEDLLFRLNRVDKEEAKSIDKYIEQLGRVDLLIIDDLGAEQPSSFFCSTLLKIMESRILNQKPYIFTTNQTLEAINKRYNDRVFSRLFMKVDVLEFTSRDLRIASYQEHIYHDNYEEIEEKDY